MKRLLLLAVIAVMLIAVVVPVSAVYPYTFQDWDVGWPNICYGLECPPLDAGGRDVYLYNTSTGGIGVRTPLSGATGIMGGGAYLAFDAHGVINYFIRSYDEKDNVLQTKVINVNGGVGYPTLLEMEISPDGYPSYYVNGVFDSMGGQLTTTPKNFSVNSGNDNGYIDNIRLQRVNAVVGAIPTNWTVVHDVFTGVNGVYAYAADGTLVQKNSVYMTVDVSGGGILQILDPSGNVVYTAPEVPSGYSQAVPVNLATMLAASNNAYGLYSACAGGACDSFWVTGAGATLSWDKNSYVTQETATLTYVITDSYFDRSTYSYTVEVTNANTGAIMSTQPITESFGTVTYTFPPDAANGEYYAALIETRNSDSTRIYMAVDSATLFGYFTISGYVNDAETGLVVAGANVTVTQDTKASINITGSNGYYTADDSFLPGLATTLNTTAAGYSQYYRILTVIKSGGVLMNISINSTTPAFGGKGFGGVDREGALNQYTITNGYGKPIEGATVLVTNITSGISYTKTTSMTGWYSCSESESCILPTGKLYNISATKTGYNRSPYYGVLIP